jgi:ribosomal protein S18 acetylase RimI-like enzyme
MHVRIFQEEKDSKQVLALISDIIVGEFHFKLELEEGALDSDLLNIEEHYKSGGRFWVVEDGNKIVGTTGVRKLVQSTCELKRMYVSKPYRRSGIAQKMLDVAIEFARSADYSRMVLDSSKSLTAARSLYLKNGFVDTERYNDNYRADLFMQKQL